MVHLQPKKLRKYLRNCDSDVILVLCECLHNVLLGHVRVKVRDLEKNRHIFESVLKKKSSMDKRRALFLTKTGFELIQLILIPKVYFDSQKSIYERADIFLINSK